jgi:acyl CoA:acetate/3-ketoacid CoA transferase alpha subunit
VSRAFNQRLKKLVDNTETVHFAQTYPQQVLLPKRQVQEGEVVATEVPQGSRT